LSWQGASDGNAGSGIHAYRVYRDGERVGEVTEPVTRFPAPFAAPNRFFLDQTLAADTNYSFTVTAVDRLDNESAPSAPILVPTPPCAEESGPPDQLTLTWDRNDGRDVAGYILYWGLRPGDYAWAMDTMDATSAEISDLIPGVTYFFTATAYDREEMQSAPSAEIAYITRIVATPSLQPAAIPSR